MCQLSYYSCYHIHTIPAFKITFNKQIIAGEDFIIIKLSLSTIFFTTDAN